MRISDWSSDVCSSDLPALHHTLPLTRTTMTPSLRHGPPSPLSPPSRPITRWPIFPCSGIPAPARKKPRRHHRVGRSEEHTSELQSLMRISYAVLCLKKKTSTCKDKHSSQSTHQSETITQ